MRKFCEPGAGMLWTCWRKGGGVVVNPATSRVSGGCGVRELGKNVFLHFPLWLQRISCARMNLDALIALLAKLGDAQQQWRWEMAEIFVVWDMGFPNPLVTINNNELLSKTNKSKQSGRLINSLMWLKQRNSIDDWETGRFNFGCWIW